MSQRASRIRQKKLSILSVLVSGFIAIKRHSLRVDVRSVCRCECGTQAIGRAGADCTQCVSTMTCQKKIEPLTCNRNPALLLDNSVGNIRLTARVRTRRNNLPCNLLLRTRMVHVCLSDYCTDPAAVKVDDASVQIVDAFECSKGHASEWDSNDSKYFRAYLQLAP